MTPAQGFRRVAVGVAGALVLQVSAPAAAADLGRLFFTPERRAALDRQRELNLPQAQRLGENDALTVNGLVVRTSGKRTIWINGAPVNEDSPLLRFHTTRTRPGQARIASGQNAATVSVGSSVLPSTGAVTTPLGDGSIRVRER